MTMLVASIGLYGLAAQDVGGRRREIRLRLALGAHTTDIVRMLLLETCRLMMVGLALGIVTAIVVLRGARGVYAGLPTQEPVTILGVALLLSIVGAFATYIPARRASGISPTTALRS